MRSVSMLLCAGILASVLGGCSQSQKASETATSYECPMCKDEVTWVYGSWREPAGSPVRRKVVTHSCPDCKTEWAAGVSPTNVCQACAKAEQQCPACARKT